ncbi:MAG TPA: hypothetical protein VFF70_01785, partial [Anaerolineae bacterium]|nr:hypothetical protein [Anaerolineae bacterium]
YKTKRGTVKFTLHNCPRYWTAEYHWGGWRAKYEVRLESFGEAWTRMTIEIDLQPQSFLARVQSSATRSKTNRYLKSRLAAAAQKFYAALPEGSSLT